MSKESSASQSAPSNNSLIIGKRRGLLLDPIKTVLPACLSNAIEIIPDRLYWVSCNKKNEPADRCVCVFNTDDYFTYTPFYLDFGPLSLSVTYRYCVILEKKLKDPLSENLRLIHCTADNELLKPNSIYLLMSFCIIVLGWSPHEAMLPLQTILHTLRPFRDAAFGPCSYRLTLWDCACGLSHAIALGWFKYDEFDLLTYEHYDRLENGDLHWIIPHKFIAFSGPEEKTSGIRTHTLLSPSDYVPIFKTLGVNLVIRLNKKQYDSQLFISQGIRHVDLYFLDGSCPPKELMYKFLDITEKEPGAIAVHCKAGLGRTGTLIGCYAIKNFGFSGSAWIAWNRICRPASILGPQQHFLSDIEEELRHIRQKSSVNYALTRPVVLSHSNISKLLENMTLEDMSTAKEGDLGQGHRLVSTKKQLQWTTYPMVLIQTKEDTPNKHLADTIQLKNHTKDIVSSCHNETQTIQKDNSLLHLDISNETHLSDHAGSTPLNNHKKEHMSLFVSDPLTPVVGMSHCPKSRSSRRHNHGLTPNCSRKSKPRLPTRSCSSTLSVECTKKMIP